MAYPVLTQRVIDLENKFTDPDAVFQGTAASALKLKNPVNIGGKPFDGSQDVDLPGVNLPGSQNTTGTSAAWATARKLTLTGDVTGTASIKGDADVVLNTTLNASPSGGDGSVKHWALISADATIGRSSAGVTVTQPITGQYTIRLPSSAPGTNKMCVSATLVFSGSSTDIAANVIKVRVSSSYVCDVFILTGGGHGTDSEPVNSMFSISFIY